MNDVLHYLGYDTDAGGIVSVVRNLAAARQFNVALGLSEGGAQQRSPALPQMEFIPLNGEALNPQTFWRSRQVAREVRTWLAGDPKRVFHGHSRAGMAVAHWLHLWGECRVVVSVHCYGRRRWFYRQTAAKLGRRMFWLSPAMKRYYEVSDPESWSQCIPGGVRLSEGTRRSAARAEGEGFRLVGVGACAERKRWDLVLSALARMPRDVSFTHIGGQSRGLQQLTGDLGLTERVTWRGTEPDSCDILSRADALVVASENEPFAMAMLEALAAGVPVIAADSGGAIDVIEPGGNGELFASGDPAALAAALARWRARGVVPERPSDSWRFAATQIARQWAEVYQSLGQD